MPIDTNQLVGRSENLIARLPSHYRDSAAASALGARDSSQRRDQLPPPARGERLRERLAGLRLPDGGRAAEGRLQVPGSNPDAAGSDAHDGQFAGVNPAAQYAARSVEPIREQ
jgi:hypothetical protein